MPYVWKDGNTTRHVMMSLALELLPLVDNQAKMDNIKGVEKS